MFDFERWLRRCCDGWVRDSELGTSGCCDVVELVVCGLTSPYMLVETAPSGRTFFPFSFIKSSEYPLSAFKGHILTNNASPVVATALATPAHLYLGFQEVRNCGFLVAWTILVERDWHMTGLRTVPCRSEE